MPFMRRGRARVIANVGCVVVLFDSGRSSFFLTQAVKCVMQSASHDHNLQCLQRVRGASFSHAGVFSILGCDTNGARLIVLECVSVAQIGNNVEAAQGSCVSAHVVLCVIGGGLRLDGRVATLAHAILLDASLAVFDTGDERWTAWTQTQATTALCEIATIAALSGPTYARHTLRTAICHVLVGWGGSC